MINNKKGQEMLIVEVSKMLIAILCLLFLVAVFVAIFLSASNSAKTKQAEGILNGKEGLITSIKTGNDYSNFNIPSPTGRYLFGFTEVKPNSCVGENCLCFCKKSNFFDTLISKKAQMKECDKYGICSVVSNLANSFEIKIKNDGTTSISVTQLNGLVEIEEN